MKPSITCWRRKCKPWSRLPRRCFQRFFSAGVILLRSSLARSTFTESVACPTTIFLAAMFDSPCTLCLPLPEAERGTGGGVFPLPPPLRFGEGAGGRGLPSVSPSPLRGGGRGEGSSLCLPLSASGRG